MNKYVLREIDNFVYLAEIFSFSEMYTFPSNRENISTKEIGVN